MAFKLSPEHWIEALVKSATNGRVISATLRRILTVIIIPLFVGLVVYCVPLYVQAIEAVPKYKTLKRLEETGLGIDGDDHNPYGSHLHRSWVNDGEITHQCQFDSQFWSYMGVNNPGHRDTPHGLLSIAKMRQEGELEKFLILPFLILVFFIIPWVIIRTVFWIKDAEKVKVGV